MRFPATDDAGDYLVYHRMTGLGGGGPGSYSSAADVAVLRRGGCVLEPYLEREGDEEYGPEMFGIAPIDVAAGDGGAVFCSPFAPVDPELWGMAHIKQAPGVAFRLGDLTALHPVSVRPIDFQNFYLQFVTTSPIAGAYERLARLSEIEANMAADMELLEPAFAIMRLAETYAAFDALDGIYRAGARSGAPREVPMIDSDITRAAEHAAEFVYEWELQWEGDEVDDAIMAGVVDMAAASLGDAYSDAMSSWERVTPATAEVLVWGGVPLSLAVLAFDSHDIIELEPLEAMDEIAGVPAAKLGNG